MKCFFSTLTLLSLLISLAPSTSIGTLLTARAATETSSFSDVYSDHEYLPSIQYLKANNIVEGYQVEGSEDRQYRPDYQLNRAELTKIMIEAQFTAGEIEECINDKELKDWDTVYFDDVNIDDWFAKYVCLAKEKGVVNGYPDGSFKPAQPVNFAEAAKVIINALDLDTPTEPGDEWYKPFVRALENRNGIPHTVRSFPKLITRGEMAKMIHAGKEEVAGSDISLDKLEETDAKETELPQISSCNALIEKLVLDRDQDYLMRELDFAVPLDARETLDFSSDEETVGATAPQAEMKSEATAGGDGAADFSETNVQVEGVDEADIIKNDGKYIYMIKGKTVRIIEAYPASGLKELSTIELDDENFNPLEIYVDDDQLVIIGNVWAYRHYPVGSPIRPILIDDVIFENEIAIWPGPSFNRNRVKTYIYDISDRSNPERQRSIEIEGNYTSSRKVGKNVYFVLNQWIPYYNIQEGLPADIILPRFKDSAHGDEEKPLVRCTGIQYFPDFHDRNYLIVAGLNISDLDGELNRKVLLGSSQNIYASKTGLYVATPHYREVTREEDNDISITSEQATRVYRFKLSGEEIEYQNQGTVPGNILNQFSMDESGNYFRMGTTRSGWNSSLGSFTGNNLYILNKNSMEIVGSVEDIAPGESIKSMRFMGKRAYMVTFKNIDPLFVIDVSNPLDPKIMGKLKIPGWSDYLHPYDEDHLIGFGREVDPAAEDAERITPDLLMGMKLSIFDVSDITNPIESHKLVIGQRGTTSELLRNHKALLFDADKNLLAFPISITELKDPDLKPDYGNITTTFSGGIVFNVNLEDGFTEVGKVTHYEDDSQFENSGEYFYGEFGRNIQRLIYIGEYLYSISPDYVRSYDLDDVDPINFIKLSGPKSDDVKYLEEEPVF